jgi:hypothetical protein
MALGADIASVFVPCAAGAGMLVRAGSHVDDVADVAGAAARAASTVGAGRGSVYGTHVHTAFAAEVRSLGRSNLHPEVSYLNGIPVRYGKPGSVRLDVVKGPKAQPTGVWDLKTVSARLTASRIAQIRRHLPKGYQNIPVLEVRP